MLFINTDNIQLHSLKYCSYDVSGCRVPVAPFTPYLLQVSHCSFLLQVGGWGLYFFQLGLLQQQVLCWYSYLRSVI